MKVHDYQLEGDTVVVNNTVRVNRKRLDKILSDVLRMDNVSIAVEDVWKSILFEQVAFLLEVLVPEYEKTYGEEKTETLRED